MTEERTAVAIVGAGPRGLMVLERLCANATADTRLDIHVVDPYPPGPGRVWRVDQPGDLLMNTVASQVTVFTDETVPMTGRPVPGPSRYEAARLHRPTGGPAGRAGPEHVPEPRPVRPLSRLGLRLRGVERAGRGRRDRTRCDRH